MASWLLKCLPQKRASCSSIRLRKVFLLALLTQDAVNQIPELVVWCEDNEEQKNLFAFVKISTRNNFFLTRSGGERNMVFLVENFLNITNDRPVT